MFTGTENILAVLSVVQFFKGLLNFYVKNYILIYILTSFHY